MKAKEQGLADTILKMQEPERLRAENERLRAALRDLLDAYLADVNPNDRNETAIEHARRHLEQTPFYASGGETHSGHSDDCPRCNAEQKADDV